MDRTAHGTHKGSPRTQGLHCSAPRAAARTPPPGCGTEVTPAQRFAPSFPRLSPLFSREEICNLALFFVFFFSNLLLFCACAQRGAQLEVVAAVPAGARCPSPCGQWRRHPRRIVCGRGRWMEVTSCRSSRARHQEKAVLCKYKNKQQTLPPIYHLPHPPSTNMTTVVSEPPARGSDFSYRQEAGG